MNPIVRNSLAVIAGFLVGSLVNMTIINYSSSIIPLPDGVDPNDMESLKKNIQYFEPKHFLMPWLAHALGTLVGAFIAARISTPKYGIKFALGIAAFFMLGGIVMATELPESPVWFIVADIALAYLPMGWLGGQLARK